MMGLNKTVGIISMILGLIFIIFPMFSSELVSVIVGVSLLFFGLSTLFMGIGLRSEYGGMTAIASIIIGIIAIIFGLLFIFSIDALSFLTGLQFYIVGIIMIVFGIVGLISRPKNMSIFTPILVFIFGIITIALGTFAFNHPIYLAIIIGLILIIEGISMVLMD